MGTCTVPYLHEQKIKTYESSPTTGNHTYQAHRIVLAAAIPYFRAMFLNDMMEASMNEIRIHTVEPSGMHEYMLGVLRGAGEETRTWAFFGYCILAEMGLRS